MRRRIIAVIWAVLMIALLVGCGAVNREPREYEGRMKAAGNGIWIDTETGVCYFGTNRGGYTVIVNQDGTPYIANGWRDYGE